MSEMRIRSEFHDTETMVQVEETFIDHEGQWAEVRALELARANQELCGLYDCPCPGPHCVTDENGRVYLIKPVE